MIQEIKVQNFQSHKNSIMKLSEGVNVIYGPSDNGKSSIIRALKWIVSNRPQGDSFRRNGTDKTSVSIKINNSIIHRRKSKSINSYKVNQDTLKALRTAVPEQVESITNLSEVNIQAQHEVYFLVDIPPGQRSKKLNDVAGLEIMDTVLKKTNTEIRGINSEIKNAKRSLEFIDQDIKSLSWVNDAGKFLSRLEKLDFEITRAKSNVDSLSSIVSGITLLEEKKDKFLSDAFIGHINEFVKLKDMIDDREERVFDLQNTVDKIRQFENTLSKIVVIDVSDLIEKRNLINRKQSKLDRIQDTIEEIEFKQNQYKQVLEAIDETEKKIKVTLKKLGICPTCKRKV
jgi:exonuclease SbcC